MKLNMLKKRILTERDRENDMSKFVVGPKKVKVLKLTWKMTKLVERNVVKSVKNDSATKKFDSESIETENVTFFIEIRKRSEGL